MITAILAFLQAAPAIIGGVNAFAAKYFDAKVQLTAARIGGDVNVVKAAMTTAAIEQQTRVAGLKVIASSKGLMFLVIAFALPFIAYEWQCIVWDKIIMHGTTATDPIKGNLADWGNTIIVSLFGSGTAVTLAHAYLHRDKTGE